MSHHAPTPSSSKRRGKLKTVEKDDGWSRVERPVQGIPKQKYRPFKVKAIKHDSTSISLSSPGDTLSLVLSSREKSIEAWDLFILGSCHESLATTPDQHHRNEAQLRYTFAELSRNFSREHQIWKICPERAQLHRRLAGYRDACKRVTSSTCLGLGSLSSVSHGGNGMVQLVVWLDVRELLSAQSDEPIQYHAQDPLFTTTDISFLTSHDVSVLAHPHGLDKIDETTFLYAPHFPLKAARYEILSCNGPFVVVNDIESGLSDKLPSTEQMTAKHANMLASIHDPAIRKTFDEHAAYDLDVHERIRDFLEAHENAGFVVEADSQRGTYFAPFAGMRMYVAKHNSILEQEEGEVITSHRGFDEDLAEEVKGLEL